MRIPGKPRHPWRWALLLAGAAYLVAAVLSLDVNWSRILEGTNRGRRFVEAFLHPQFGVKAHLIWIGLVESVNMTIASTILGVLLAVPIGFLAARNLVSRPVYLAARGLVGISRTFHELVVAILFVAMFGFGPFAGVLTLAFATIGFLSKLLAEDIENIDRAPLEAVVATGASRGTLWLWAVFPQVRARIGGLALYRLDINFRESAVLGVVGAGGIGATLSTAVERSEFGVATTIIFLIIGIVMLVEAASNQIRKRLL
jgi:phosphonate transport system permease protein